MNRRNAVTALSAGGILAFIRATGAKAQQSAGNDLQIVATGDVNASQHTAATQTASGLPVIVRTASGQTIYNDAQIVSTGDVNLEQDLAAVQVYSGEVGAPVETGVCLAGDYYVAGDLLYFCTMNCQWASVRTCPVKRRCHGSC